MSLDKDIQYFVDERGHNVIFFPADYIEMDVKSLYNEYKENEKKYGKGFFVWEIKGKGARDLKEGDICYIYYTNLPIKSGFPQSRILFRAIVSEEPREMAVGEIYKNADVPDKKTIGFTVVDVQPIELSNYKKYSWDSLRDEYGFGDRAPSSTMKLQNKHEKLYQDIEANFMDFEGLADYLKKYSN